MATRSQWTELLTEAFLEQVDALCEEIKGQLGWPPLGMAELSASGARSRRKDDAAILSDLFARIGPERSLELLKKTGLELVDTFGEQVVAEGMRTAQRTFAADAGADGREAFVEQEGGTRNG